MFLLRRAGSGKQVVQDMEVTLAGWDRSNSRSLKSVVQKLSSDQVRVCLVRSLVLELEEQSGLRGTWRSGGLCGRQRVE